MSDIKKNMAYQAFYEVLIILLPLLTSPYISRLLGPDKMGVYSYTYSIAVYFQIFCMLGIKFYGNRSVARVKGNSELLNKTFCEIFTAHLIFSALSVVCYAVYVIFFAEYKPYSAVFSLIVIASMLDISWLFFGLEKFKTTTLYYTLIKILSVLCIFVFVRSPEDLWRYLLIMSLVQLADSVVLILLSRKYVRYRLPRIKDVVPHIKPLLLLFIPILAQSLFKYMDKIMLGAADFKTELGYYENAEKTLNIPLSIIFSFGVVMMPHISSLVAAQDKEKTERYLQISVKYIVGLSFALAAGLAAVSDVFAPVFFGDKFAESGRIIALLSVSIPFSALASVTRNQDMIPNGKDRQYSISVIAGAAVNLALNILLIPRLKAYGVALGTVAAETVVCILQVCLLREVKKYLRHTSKALVFAVPAALMYAAVRFLGNVLGYHIYTLVIQLLAGIVIFVSTAVIMMLIIKDRDLEIIRKKVKRKC